MKASSRVRLRKKRSKRGINARHRASKPLGSPARPRCMAQLARRSSATRVAGATRPADWGDGKRGIFVDLEG